MRGAVESSEERESCFKSVITTQTKSVITILANMIVTLCPIVSISPFLLVIVPAIDTFLPV